MKYESSNSFNPVANSNVTNIVYSIVSHAINISHVNNVASMIEQVIKDAVTTTNDKQEAFSANDISK